MVIPQAINYKRVWEWINEVWAKSLIAFGMFLIGISIGQIQAESRIVSDCKFAGAFRSEIQAFNCQRRI
jgi:hypothetical protein